MKWKEAKKILLENDPNLREELDRLEPKYQLIRQIIELRKVQNLSQEELAKRILNQEYYSYHWDDGWTVRVTINKVNGNESRRLNRKSLGFYGYDWMINSIIKTVYMFNKHALLILVDVVFKNIMFHTYSI